VGTALTRVLEARGFTVKGTHGRVASPSTVALDLADLAAVTGIVEDGVDCVFFPAALTWVDRCEAEPAEAMRVNRDAPAAAARAAAKQGVPLVFYSTEYVFDGERGDYDEDSTPSPTSVYGRSKLEGERAVLEANPRAVVVRTSVVYGPDPQGKNFVAQLRRRLAAGEEMRVPVDQVSCPTYNADLAAASVELVEQRAGGVFHVVGPEAMDRATFARLACELFGLDARGVRPVTTAELGQPARRPLSGALRTDRVRALLTTRMRGPREGLQAMKEAVRG
jgi:dTDP-4-dehydrorhamnose reductase